MCTRSWRFGQTDKPVGGFGEYADLFAGYYAESRTNIDPNEVGYWEVFGSFWWAIGCLLMSDHYRHGADRTVERPAVGRRSSECQIDCVNYLIPGPIIADTTSAASNDTALPSTGDLVDSVRNFLRRELGPTLSEHQQSLVRVAANSLEIVGRDLVSGGTIRESEHARLHALLEYEGSLTEPRWALVHKLRAGTLALIIPHSPPLCA